MYLPHVFGLDYARISFFDTKEVSLFFERFFNAGLSASSNYLNLSVNGYACQLQYFDTRFGPAIRLSLDSVPCVQVLRCENALHNYRYQIDYSSGFFQVVPLAERIIDSLILRFRDACRLSRLDIAADYLVSIDDILGHVYDDGGRISFTGVTTRGANTSVIAPRGKIQTAYIGDRNSPRGFFRIYDKKADTAAKQKHKVFPWVLNHESVTRVELQLNNGYLRKLKNFKTSDKAAIFNRFISDSRAVEFHRLQKFDAVLDLEEVQRVAKKRSVTGYERLRRLANLARSLQAEGFDPIHFLEYELRGQHKIEYESFDE